jgi:hypothetical protein
MVASVGSVEDASQDSTYHSKEWAPVIRNHFVKKTKNFGNKGIGNIKISKRIEQLNNNAMRVFVGSTDIANNTKTVVDAPHKPRRVEAFRKQKIMKKKMPIKVTSKKFSNKEFEKIIEQGLQEVQKYYYEVPNVSRSIKMLRIYLKATVAYVDK